MQSFAPKLLHSCHTARKRRRQAHRNTLLDKVLHLEPRRTSFARRSPIVKTSVHYAHWLLRLLLDADAGGNGLHELDWDLLLHVARTNGVLVRTAERLAAQGVTVPDRFAAAVAQERQRIRSALELMRLVGRACEARGITFLFPKALQDYPDFGDDVDLLVLPRSTRVDPGILAGLHTTPVKRDLGELLAGATTYRVAGCPSPLDVQHGRLGMVGEYGTFPLVLVQHARPGEVDGIKVAVPRLEDQLVLQGMQRIAGRLRIALCDIVFTVSTVRRATLNWDYVIATAGHHGALPGLSCYLSYVDQIHRDVFWRPLLPAAVCRSLMLPGWGRIEYRDGGYRFPLVRVNGRLSWRQLRQRIAAGDWAGAGRLCLIPIVAAARLIGRVTRAPEPPAAPGHGVVRAKPLAHAGVGE